MARRPAPRRPRRGGASPAVFYGLVALLGALFLAAAWATLEEPERPASVALAQPPASPTPPPPPSATSTPALTPTQTAVPPTSTPAVVVVERRPPTQTPRPSATATAGPPATSTPPPPTSTSTPVPATTTPTGTSTTTPIPSPTETPPPPTATPIVHVVEPGDSFQRLGQRYGVPWQAIAAANGLPENAVLQIGQQLVIPAPS